MGVFRYLFSTRGRINRAKLWLFVPISFVAEVALLAICPEANEPGTAARLLSGFLYIPPDGAAPVYWAGTAFDLMMAWVGVALTVKRLHDRDKGAWWLVLMWLVPNISSAIALYQFGMLSDGFMRTAPLPAWQQIIMLFLSMITLWAFIELYCRRGSRGDNRFGPDPLARKRATTEPAAT